MGKVDVLVLIHPPARQHVKFGRSSVVLRDWIIKLNKKERKTIIGAVFSTIVKLLYER